MKLVVTTGYSNSILGAGYRNKQEEPTPLTLISATWLYAYYIKETAVKQRGHTYRLYYILSVCLADRRAMKYGQPNVDATTVA